jgi:hypothetical protein
MLYAGAVAAGAFAGAHVSLFGSTIATPAWAYVALFGLLVAGLAVPLFIARLAPRWIGGTGIVLAVVGELALLSLATDALQPLLPLARFPGTLWMLVVAAVLVPRRSAASR